MKKQEIKRAVDLIGFYYANAIWYEKEKGTAPDFKKAFRERNKAKVLELYMQDIKCSVVVHKTEWGKEFAVVGRIDKSTVYIKWIVTTCHPWDEISFDLFESEVKELKNAGFRVLGTDGKRGMCEIF